MDVVMKTVALAMRYPSQRGDYRKGASRAGIFTAESGEITTLPKHGYFLSSFWPASWTWDSIFDAKAASSIGN